MKIDKVVDAKGLVVQCLVKTKKGFWSNYKGAKNDFSAWAKSAGHELLKHEEENDVLEFWIKKR
ncbi:sulfurtransferase TusA family protein [Bacillus cihuensis]|uniref:sulfurtransferase TusA family protein n=1 Tax=Bacillus cihuensis TaxID=1208599 RepID=UPI00042223E7|nr:sulfurtransferase TusA family protein [Bacillus cihuensis]